LLIDSCPEAGTVAAPQVLAALSLRFECSVGEVSNKKFSRIVGDRLSKWRPSSVEQTMRHQILTTRGILVVVYLGNQPFFVADHGVLSPRRRRISRQADCIDAGACRMDTTLTLVDLGGAIALLIWGVHMVQTGITRAFGPQLRRMLSYALGNRFKAFLAGLGVTSILQSSTATGLTKNI
jgi:Na+/Pi-cotransporter